MFFKHLFSGNYPKRGIDFEAKVPDENISTINNPQKTFAKRKEPQSRLEELLSMEGKAQDIGGYFNPDEAKAEKAMRPSATLNAIIDAI